jgi:hypothetical protein
VGATAEKRLSACSKDNELQAGPAFGVALPTVPRCSVAKQRSARLHSTAPDEPLPLVCARTKKSGHHSHRYRIAGLCLHQTPKILTFQEKSCPHFLSTRR